jgi:hypothetical protein
MLHKRTLVQSVQLGGKLVAQNRNQNPWIDFKIQTIKTNVCGEWNMYICLKNINFIYGIMFTL